MNDSPEVSELRIYFEKWVLAGPEPGSVERKPMDAEYFPGEYVNEETWSAWEAWSRRLRFPDKGY